MSLRLLRCPEQGSFTGTAQYRTFVFNDGSVINNGTVTNDGAFTNTGTLEVALNASLAGSGIYVQNGGKTRVDGTMSQAAITLNSGVFAGSGLVQGDLLDPRLTPLEFYNNGGTIAPGDPVTLTIDGNLTVTAGLLGIRARQRAAA